MNIIISEKNFYADEFILWKILLFSSQLRELMEHADQVKDKDLIEVRFIKVKIDMNDEFFF